MKVPVWVETSQEVEVEITLEDIVEAISTSANGEREVLHGLGKMANFWEAIPDEMIARFNQQQREVIAGWLGKQLARFSP